MRRALSLLFVAFFGLAAAGPAHAETLTQAAQNALNTHPTVQAAIAERDYAKAQAQEKYSNYFPQLNINTDGGRVYGDNSTSRGLTFDRGAGYSGMGEGSVSLTETLFNGFQTQNHVAAARTRVRSANENIIGVREGLALRVATAYLDVLRARQSVAMIREYTKKIADYRSRIEKMVTGGAADQSMAVQAQDIQNQLDGTLADVEGQLHKSAAEYTEAVGHPAADPLTRPVLDAGLIPADAGKAIAIAQAGHPGLLSARLQGAAAQDDARAEKGTLYPSLTGELSYYKKDVSDLIGGEVTDARAVLRLNWDFSTGGAQLAKIRQQRERETELQANARDFAGRLDREIRKAYAEMNAANKRLAVSRDRVEISKNLVSTYEKQFQAGKLTILNLLQAENTAFNARLGLLNADYRYQAAQYAVLADMGRLQTTLGLRAAPEEPAQIAKQTTPITLPVKPFAKPDPSGWVLTR